MVSVTTLKKLVIDPWKLKYKNDPVIELVNTNNASRTISFIGFTSWFKNRISINLVIQYKAVINIAITKTLSIFTNVSIILNIETFKFVFKRKLLH